jgi:Rieske 2Fe-2S protein
MRPSSSKPISSVDDLRVAVKRARDVECPWHRSCFNIKTGRITRGPAMEDVATYKVRLAGDAVEVEVQESRRCVDLRRHDHGGLSHRQ